VSRFSATGGAILVAFLVAACSGSSPSAQQSTGLEQSAPASVAASSATSQAAGPSYAPGAGSLEGIVPETVGGITITYQYATGAGVLNSGGITPQIQAFLDQVHASASDISSAIGRGVDSATSSAIGIYALRVAGADEGVLRDAFRQAMEENSSVAFVEQTVGGKQVLAIPSQGPEPPTYMYVHSDVVFVVGASSADLAAEALAALP
jgi:hypothetical protein